MITLDISNAKPLPKKIQKYIDNMVRLRLKELELKEINRTIKECEDSVLSKKG